MRGAEDDRAGMHCKLRKTKMDLNVPNTGERTRCAMGHFKDRTEFAGL